MEINFYNKYIKYKTKYNALKNLLGGQKNELYEYNELHYNIQGENPNEWLDVNENDWEFKLFKSKNINNNNNNNNNNTRHTICKHNNEYHYYCIHPGLHHQTILNLNTHVERKIEHNLYLKKHNRTKLQKINTNIITNIKTLLNNNFIIPNEVNNTNQIKDNIIILNDEVCKFYVQSENVNEWNKCDHWQNTIIYNTLENNKKYHNDTINNIFQNIDNKNIKNNTIWKYNNIFYICYFTDNVDNLNILNLENGEYAEIHKQHFPKHNGYTKNYDITLDDLKNLYNIDINNIDIY
jgi:hypothetical protein